MDKIKGESRDLTAGPRVHLAESNVWLSRPLCVSTLFSASAPSPRIYHFLSQKLMSSGTNRGPLLKSAKYLGKFRENLCPRVGWYAEQHPHTGILGGEKNSRVEQKI